MTTANSSDICQPKFSNPVYRSLDGINGIDNAWGAKIIPLIQNALSTILVSDVATRDIKAGRWTLQFLLRGVPSNPFDSVSDLSASVFASGPLPAVPTFDLSLQWPVSSTSLVSGTLESGAKTTFLRVYDNSGVVVASEASGPIDIPLGLRGNLTIRVHSPSLLFRLDSSATKATEGVLAGVLDVTELTTAITTWLETSASSFGPICGPSSQQTADVVAASADILSDLTNHPGTACNAISIGIGFTATQIGTPTTVGPALPEPKSLCDGG